MILSEKIAAELFDTGVNMGTGQSAKFLQRALNSLNNGGTLYDDLIVDGGLGNATLEALTAYMKRRRHNGEETLFNMLNGLQVNFYIELTETRPKDEKFNHGWQSNRVQIMGNPKAQSAELDELLSSPAPAPHDHAGLGPAFDTPEATTAAEAPVVIAKRDPWYKRALTSKINWTTITAVAIGSGILGNVEMTPEQQAQVVQNAGAVGGLAIMVLRTFFNNPK
jgi:lysozyme family protein